jgi:hypothetical protein
MRRVIARLVLALALVAPTTALIEAPAAHADWYAWSTTPCRPDVAWFATENWVAYSTNGGYNFYVYKNWPGRPSEMDIYARYNWQCGPLGAPTGQMHWNSQGWYTGTFERGSLWWSELGYWYICYNGGGCYYA